MSERTVEEIRTEIDAERQRLDDDLTALQSEIRSLGVLVTAGLVIVALVAWRKGRGKASRRYGSSSGSATRSCRLGVLAGWYVASTGDDWSTHWSTSPVS